MRLLTATTVLLSCILSDFANAAPMETIDLSGARQQGAVRGEVTDGGNQTYIIQSQSKDTKFVVVATEGSCGLDVTQMPTATGVTRYLRFPASFTSANSKGDKFTLLFFQTRSGWVAKTPCVFSVSINP